MAYYQPSITYGGTYGLLEISLKDILSIVKPLENDQVKRLNAISEFATLVGSVESLRGAAVKPFGSFVSNLHTRWGDLDISVQFSQSINISTGRKRKQNLLRDIMKALRRTGLARKFQFIPNARVPLLIFESYYQNISCDVSIDNHLGQIKSKILLWISDIDERFRDIVLLTKEWAKAQNINDPKSGTLNSYSLCTLVIFHFQTLTPAILPPLKDIYAGNIADDITGTRFITERCIEDLCAANIASFRSRGIRQINQSSLSQLLISFFEKFSRIEALSSEYAICTYTGQWEKIGSKPRWVDKPYAVLIEDPFEQPDNAARAVGRRELIMISEAFTDTHRKLSSRSVLSNRNSLLASLVRSDISSQLGAAPPQGRYTANGGLGHQPRFETTGVRTPQGHYTANGSLRHQPLVETTNYTAHRPVHEQFQDALRLDSRPSSSTTVTLPRQRAVNAQGQQVWRSRNQNR